jgi:hypothetical protein
MYETACCSFLSWIPLTLTVAANATSINSFTPLLHNHLLSFNIEVPFVYIQPLGDRLISLELVVTAIRPQSTSNPYEQADSGPTNAVELILEHPLGALHHTITIASGISTAMSHTSKVNFFDLALEIRRKIYDYFGTNDTGCYSDYESFFIHIHTFAHPRYPNQQIITYEHDQLRQLCQVNRQFRFEVLEQLLPQSKLVLDVSDIAHFFAHLDKIGQELRGAITDIIVTGMGMILPETVEVTEINEETGETEVWVMPDESSTHHTSRIGCEPHRRPGWGTLIEACSKIHKIKYITIIVDHLRVKASPAWSVVEDLESLRELEGLSLMAHPRTDGLSEEDCMVDELRVLESSINLTVLNEQALNAYQRMLTRVLFGDAPGVIDRLNGFRRLKGT